MVLLRKGNATVTPSGNEMERTKKNGTERTTDHLHTKCKKRSAKQFSSERSSFRVSEALQDE